MNDDTSVAGLYVAVTGTLTHFTRTGVFNAIREMGGYPQKTITLETDILIVGRSAGERVVGPTGKSRKERDAEDRGIAILPDFLFALSIPPDVRDRHCRDGLQVASS